jgi:hypothetical protein
MNQYQTIHYPETFGPNKAWAQDRMVRPVVILWLIKHIGPVKAHHPWQQAKSTFHTCRGQLYVAQVQYPKLERTNTKFLWPLSTLVSDTAPEKRGIISPAVFLIWTVRSFINDYDLTVINSSVHQNSCLDFPTTVVISLSRCDFHVVISVQKISA